MSIVQAVSLRRRAATRALSATRGRTGLPLRYGMITLGAGLLLLGTTHLTDNAPASVRLILTMAPMLAGLLCCLAAGITITFPERWHRAIARWRPVMLVGAGVLIVHLLILFVLDLPVIVIAQPSSAYSTDVMAFSHLNANLVLSGQNPYTSDDIFPSALRQVPRVWPTPLRRGAFGTGFDFPDPKFESMVTRQYLATPGTMHGEFDPATLHSYPALSFLLYVPLVWMGIRNVLLLNLIVYAGLFAWLVSLAPVGLRRWAALTAATASIILTRSMMIDTELICATFLLTAWHFRRHGWVGAVLLGLACAFKQYCWFFVPFFALDMLAAQGWRETLRRGVIALGAFLLPNLPYLIMSPGPWFRSLWVPMSEPVFPVGVGIVLMSIDHLVPFAPTVVYAALEGLALVGALWIAARWRDRLCDSVLLLALVPLFFAWRSLPNYFALAPWLALYAANLLYARRRAAEDAVSLADTLPHAARAVAVAPRFTS